MRADSNIEVNGAIYDPGDGDVNIGEALYVSGVATVAGNVLYVNGGSPELYLNDGSGTVAQDWRIHNNDGHLWFIHQTGGNRASLKNNGDLYIDGTYYCGGADVAELIGADTTSYGRHLESGDVVIVHPDKDETVGFTTTPYDTRVAGAISSAPGIMLGANGTESQVVIEQEIDVNNGAPLALVGRVPVKVTDENGPIKRGDLIVTSSTPGYAMKGDPDKVEVGMVIGKAMQEHEFGEGMIIVLVNLQ
jgi:hypothetical protein